MDLDSFDVENCRKVEKAFDRYTIIDLCFKIDVPLEECAGVLENLDRKYIRRVVEFLEHFYDVTLMISCYRYVTSNIFFYEIGSIDCLLQEWKMSDKFGKYW